MCVQKRLRSKVSLFKSDFVQKWIWWRITFAHHFCCIHIICLIECHVLIWLMAVRLLVFTSNNNIHRTMYFAINSAHEKKRKRKKSIQCKSWHIFNMRGKINELFPNWNAYLHKRYTCISCFRGNNLQIMVWCRGGFLVTGVCCSVHKCTVFIPCDLMEQQSILIKSLYHLISKSHNNCLVIRNSAVHVFWYSWMNRYQRLFEYAWNLD